MLTQKDIDKLSYSIIGCAIEVHKHLGPGLLEKIYEKCLIHELVTKGHEVRSQMSVPVVYKDIIDVECDLKLDLLIDNLIVVELKALTEMISLFEAQLLTYMKLLRKPKGILINFNCNNIVKEGQKTLVNEYYSRLPIKL